MGKIGDVVGGDKEKFSPTQADADLFDQLRHELPDEPMVQLQPRKDNPGLENGRNIANALYHHREGRLGKNASPVNSFEIWFEDGEVRFYFHPDTQQERNSAKKHFEDKFPGTRMQEETDPFPQINKDDYISGAQLTLTEHFARPIRMTQGPKSFSRDPFADLTSEMIVEGEQTSTGETVRSEDVRMVVQILIQPAKKSVSHGGLFGTDFEDFADSLKKPEMKTGPKQTMRMLFGLNPEEQAVTAKQKKTARIVSELRGEREFHFRLRVITISPYREIAKQHTERVCEVFEGETFYNPITEQGFETRPMNTEAELEGLLKDMAARRMHHSTFGEMFAMKDMLTVPELGGLIHLPNKTVNSPEINWTNMEKGAGVPTSTPDLDEVDENIRRNIQQDEEEDDDSEQKFDEEARKRTISEEDFETDSKFDLTIESEDNSTERVSAGSYGKERAPRGDGHGLETDEVLSEIEAEGADESGEEEYEEDSDDDSGLLGGIISGAFGDGESGEDESENEQQTTERVPHSDNQTREETDPGNSESEDSEPLDRLDLTSTKSEAQSIERDWDTILNHQKTTERGTMEPENEPGQESQEPFQQPDEQQAGSNTAAEDDEETHDSEGGSERPTAQSQDDLPPAVLEDLEDSE